MGNIKLIVACRALPNVIVFHFLIETAPTFSDTCGIASSTKSTIVYSTEQPEQTSRFGLHPTTCKPAAHVIDNKYINLQQ